MRIFLTGVTGGLGQRLLPRLLDIGHNVVALVRNPTMLTGHERIVVVTGDLCTPESYGHALYDVDVILHLAALTHSVDPHAYHTVNEFGTAELLKQAREHDFHGRIVYVSTRAAHPDCGAYGASKAAAERCVVESGFEYTILRPAEVYGAKKLEAVSKLAHAAAHNAFVLLPGSGEHTLAPVFADDVHDAILASLDAPSAAGNCYDLSGPEIMTCREFVEVIMAAKKRKRPILPIPLSCLALAARVFAAMGMQHPPLTADQIPRLTCQKGANIEPARHDLGFDPIPLETALSRSLL